MATILYAWELGGGLGHVSVAAPVLTNLQAAGHRVVAVVNDLASAEQLFGHARIRCYQAPRQSRPPRRNIQPLCTFAHILNNRAFGSLESALPVVNAWRWLIEDAKPDLIVFDHCPSGLLATRGMNVRRVVFGTGFTCPPAVYPLPNWRAQAASRSAQLIQDENDVLHTANEVLQAIGGPPLKYLTELYSQVDGEILTTYPELDHFGDRNHASYFGAWPAEWGAEPTWPSTPGKRVFAYLKNSNELRTTVSALKDTRQPAIVYCPNIDPSLVRDFQCRNLYFAQSPLRMSAVVATCDFAILNGTHTTMVQMLREGKPVISVPLFLEQQITGELVARMSAGVCLPEPTLVALKAAIEHMDSASNLLNGAARFAKKYGGVSSAEALDQIVHRLTCCLAGSN